MVIVCVCVDELMLYLYPSFPLAFMHVCSQWHAREILGCDEIFGGCVFKFYSEGVYLNLMGQPNIKNVLEFCGPAKHLKFSIKDDFCFNRKQLYLNIQNV